MKIVTTMLLGAGLLMSAFSAAQAETRFKLALPQPTPAQMTPWPGHPGNSVLPVEIKCYPGGGCCENFNGKRCCTSPNPKPNACQKW